MSKLSQAEELILSRSWNNITQGDNQPILPFWSAMMEAFIEHISHADYGAIDGLKYLSTELHIMSKHLLAMVPKVPEKNQEQLAKNLSLDDLHIKCLQSAIVCELATLFNRLSDTAIMRITELEKGATGGSYDTIN